MCVREREGMKGHWMSCWFQPKVIIQTVIVVIPYLLYDQQSKKKEHRRQRDHLQVEQIRDEGIDYTMIR